MTGPDVREVLGWFRGFGGMPAQPGTVYLVGGGPGDPGLLSLRAAVLLSTCDVVLHDLLSPPEALELVRDGAEVRVVGRRYGDETLTRGEVDALMASEAAAGKAVVRLKGGDPFVFGRGGEEAEALHLAGIPFEVVHGVTSAVAVPGAAGIPATHRGLSAGFAVITGHEDPAKRGGHVDYETLGRFPGTLLFLMGVSHLREITSQLIAHGRAAQEPVALVRWGTTPRQASISGTLETIADEVERSGFASPAVTIVGDVASLGDGLNWRARRPLHGTSVLVPRTREQASELSARIRSLGGEPLEAPTIEVVPGDLDELEGSARDVAAGRFAALCLTSPNGVRAFARAIDAAGLDSRALAHVQTVAVVGSGTASALWSELRVVPDLVPDTATTEALAAAFPVGSGRVLLARADLATDYLPDGLREKGWDPVDVVAYRTVRPDGLPAHVLRRLEDGSIDLLAFASSSTVRNFVELVAGRPWSGQVVSIGPVTSATARELGLEVAQEADPHDLDGLVAALVRAATP